MLIKPPQRNEEEVEYGDAPLDFGTIGSIYQLVEYPKPKRVKKPNPIGFFKHGQKYI